MNESDICVAAPSLLTQLCSKRLQRGEVGAGEAGLLMCLRMNDHAAVWPLRNTTQKKAFNRVFTLNKHVPAMGAERLSDI